MNEENNKTLWPGWQTVRVIGRGSFGAVYEIEREVLGATEKAALKQILLPQNPGEVEELYANGFDEASAQAHYDGLLDGIVREYKLMGELRGHANIVNVDDIVYERQASGIGWDVRIKMELLSPLTRMALSATPERQALRLGLDLSRALIECKNHSIVHRDIKPQNIFISSYGDYKLGDFGIARTMDRTTGATKTGTFNYMAPEVYNSQPYGHQADIYSLGLVLYWLLNERRGPFLPLPPQAPTASETEQARYRRFHGDALPPPKNGGERLKAIVLKACAYDPKDRYAHAGELYNELQALDASLPPEQQAKQESAGKEPPKDDRAAAPAKRRRKGLWALVPAAAAAALALWFFLPGRQVSPAVPEAPAASEEPAEAEAPAETPASTEAPAPTATPAPTEAPVDLDTPLTTATPEPAEVTPAPEQNVTYQLQDKALIISGRGVAEDPTNYVENWETEKTRIHSLVLDTGITEIGENAFSGCTALKQVTFMGSLKKIGAFAFENCTQLKNITLPESLESIGGGAFFGCEAIESVRIPSHVTKLEPYVFSGCTELSGIVFSEKLTLIGSHAFSDCVHLRDFSLPLQLERINDNAFSNCSLIKDLHFPDSLTTIEERAFYGCSYLTYAELPPNLETLGSEAFGSCRRLYKIVLPDSLTTVNLDCPGCSSLRYIWIPATVTEIESVNLSSYAYDFRLFYAGSEEQWQQIKGVEKIGSDISILFNAKK